MCTAHNIINLEGFEESSDFNFGFASNVELFWESGAFQYISCSDSCILCSINFPASELPDFPLNELWLINIGIVVSLERTILVSLMSTFPVLSGGFSRLVKMFSSFLRGPISKLKVTVGAMHATWQFLSSDAPCCWTSLLCSRLAVGLILAWWRWLDDPCDDTLRGWCSAAVLSLTAPTLQ